ncbi:ribosomal peptide maturation radical SAM protein 1 [Rhizobium sp. BK077]|uniref:RiPP maturation radical SAM C-methyltransferase n=1 Tax=unclassified Rhizobium TaxID=2613769 RepID=UPI00160ED161|nr:MULTISPECIES: RiPP maturation radical SAM C-methyltransferase [unclassified Rhizobium]MBB3303310.1 ribosomal peptide maturation radical SAM protein 1 [Rhizobium sp. BK112]MBB3372427.1 ribosomal peptide maturation radical SAM protein 1 [Rhizobium sp. BK077]MBB4183168.1 ribosomal peptide maturation radical SAM protein 1 [Rhizobium sp. BK109]
MFALVNMPYVIARYPSMPTGLLTAILRQKNLPCEDLYPNLEFAAETGLAEYDLVCRLGDFMLGDLLFAPALTGRRLNCSWSSPYFSRIRDNKFVSLFPGGANGFSTYVERVANEVAPRFVSSLVQSRDWGKYALVGFTTTFQQQTAVLALAKSLKESFPSTKIVLGGANVHGEMGVGWMEAAPYVDFVCDGEGDDTLPLLVEAVLENWPLINIPNLLRRDGRHIVSGPSQPRSVNVSSLPPPDYDAFYDSVRRLGLDDVFATFPRTIPIETSRGCWWGQKQHCVFCGLNNETMVFRAKSADRVFDELSILSKKYSAHHVQVVDNIISRDFFHTLLPRLSQEAVDLSFFYEIKANVSLQDMRCLANAGVRTVQPGIESLNSDVLRLMKKGVKKLQNILLLKWAKYFGIDVSWNLLYGLKDEKAEWYDTQAAEMPILYHLKPPEGISGLALERFSPMFTSSAELGITEVRPHFAYSEIYEGVNGLDLSKIAYHFDFELEGGCDPAAYSNLRVAAQRWREAHALGAELKMFRLPDGAVLIEDRRVPAQVTRIALKGTTALLFQLMGERIMSPSVAAETLSQHLGGEVSSSEVARMLDSFVSRGLAAQEGANYLTLAVPVSRLYETFDSVFEVNKGRLAAVA